jgi:outer membrane lipoprotein SlyB
MMRAGAAAVVVLASAWLAAAVHAQGAGGPCENCGTVQSITQVDVDAQWTPLGSMPSTNFAGADPSSQPGRVSAQYQIGRDGSNQGMVLLGSAGGAVYARRPDSGRDKRWQVTVKMDQGAPRVLVQAYEPALQEGDRVYVYGTQLELIAS